MNILLFCPLPRQYMRGLDSIDVNFLWTHPRNAPLKWYIVRGAWYSFMAYMPSNGCFTSFFRNLVYDTENLAISTTIYEGTWNFLSLTPAIFPFATTVYEGDVAQWSIRSQHTPIWPFPHYIKRGDDSHNYFQLHPLQIVSPATVYEGHDAYGYHHNKFFKGILLFCLHRDNIWETNFCFCEGVIWPLSRQYMRKLYF